MKLKLTSISRLAISCLMLVALSFEIHGQRTSSYSPKSGVVDSCETVTIMGAVRTPSRFEFTENVHLNEVIACAGGLTDIAGRNVQVLHVGASPSCGKSGDANKLNLLTQHSVAGVMRGEELSNPVVEAGDLIVVQELEPVYVIGNVAKPQMIQPKEPITLTRAIELAGGVTREGKSAPIRIIRQSVGSSGQTISMVDLKSIKKHLAVDPILQPFDIVEVSREPQGDMPRCVIFSSPDLPLRGMCRIGLTE
jgi:hypothetical protein